jgi:hypothetical protein
MKVFYIFTVLLFYVLITDALLRKRMSIEQIEDLIFKYIEENDIADPPSVFWKITLYTYTAMETIPDGTEMDVGHHWIVATPLTKQGGDFDGTVYVKLHLTYLQTRESDPNKGTIYSTISLSKNPVNEAATSIDSGETLEGVNILDMATELGTVADESFKDGANYYKYDVKSNCQGFSDCQFKKVYKKYIKQVGGCSD